MHHKIVVLGIYTKFKRIFNGVAYQTQIKGFLSFYLLKVSPNSLNYLMDFLKSEELWCSSKVFLHREEGIGPKISLFS